ncbi:hypothetical protein QBC36DRAFT_83356 [Triangularia setosa]|uniref:Uncharacterized protein n=1 Tax=Triangularia setosa TaxID=2587417 RepID=A0AAN6WHQ6_9PEZI|nr:hypothetical protein QBC36DRAFT_83356 [Podospora setosa]
MASLVPISRSSNLTTTLIDTVQTRSQKYNCDHCTHPQPLLPSHLSNSLIYARYFPSVLLPIENKQSRPTKPEKKKPKKEEKRKKTTKYDAVPMQIPKTPKEKKKKPKGRIQKKFPNGSLPKRKYKNNSRTYTRVANGLAIRPNERLNPFPTINRVIEKAKTTDAMQLGIRIQNQIMPKRSVCAYADICKVVKGASKLGIKSVRSGKNKGMSNSSLLLDQPGPRSVAM